MENDLTQWFYETISTKVVTTNKNVCWYYEDNIWKKTEALFWLINMLSQFLLMIETYPELETVARYLGSTLVRNRIVGDVKNRLYYPDFESKLNTKPNIIGVTNGTLNVLEGKVYPSRVADLLSQNTRVPYIDMESRNERKLFKILHKVFPDPDQLQFFLRSCSTFLEGKNSNKVFYVWWGSGNNCKSGMATLVQSALGDYCCTAPVSLITSKRGAANESTPELAHIENKLAVFLQEPNPHEKLKTGRLKELTGGDTIYFRRMYESGREMQITCKIIHVCNFPTASPDSDIAFKRRMNVIKFQSKFVTQREYKEMKRKGIDLSDTFLIDNTIENTLKGLGATFLYILVREFQTFTKRGLEIPEIVLRHTEEFLTTGNYALKFIRTCLSRSRDTDDVINIHDLYEYFKGWFKNHYPSYNVPNSEIFIKQLNDEGYREDDSGIVHGIQMLDDMVTVTF